MVILHKHVCLFIIIIIIMIINTINTITITNLIIIMIPAQNKSWRG